MVERAGRTVALTELGLALLPHARAIVRATARAALATTALGDTAHRVGVALSEAAVPLVMPRLATLERGTPTLTLSVRACDASTAVQAVVAGEVDLAVAVAPPEKPSDDLQRRALLLDEIVLVRSGIQELVSELDVIGSLSVLWQAPGSGVRATVEWVLEQRGLWPAESVELGSSIGVLAAAASGAGAAFLPGSFAAAWVAAGRVTATSLRTTDLFARFELISEPADQLAPGPARVYAHLLETDAEPYGQLPAES